MSIEINVLNAEASWPLAKPLFDAIWPPHVVETLAWADVSFDNPELRVLIQNEADEVLCHVGLHRRAIIWNGHKIRVAGISSVLTRPDMRRHGYASIALDAAIQTLKDEGSTPFALLFCEPRMGEFYQSRGWHAFTGAVYAEQPEGRIRFEVMAPMVLDLKRRAPTLGQLDLCGLPW